MSGIAGIFWPDAPAERLNSAIEAQADRLGRFDASVVDIVCGAHGALAVSRAADAAGIAKDDGVIVALQGRPEWSDSDLAEVAVGRGVAAALLIAYQRHGERLVERLRGTFSLAVVDEWKRAALIATDRLGTQPLRFVQIRDVFAFASDEGSLAANPLLELDVDPQMIVDYLYFHQVPAPFSIYKQVQRLLPAQYARCAAGVVERKAYWRAVFEEQRVGSWGEAAEELQRLVRRSVEENASPGTGCFLSGGVDSSTVAGMLKEAVGGDVKSFSIGFSEPGYDEMDFARISARHFGTTQIEYYVTPKDVAATVTPLAQIYGAPFGNASAVPTYWCAKVAKQNGVHRLLAGDGGDELFGGNARYAKQKLFDYYRHVPGWLRGAVEPLAARFGVEGGVWPIRKLHRYIEQAKVPMPARLETYNVLLELGAANVLHPDFVESIDAGRPERLQREWYDAVGAASLVNNMLGLDMKVTLADNDLPKVSVMCELARIDVRYPLLSDALVEFALRLPANLKVKGLRLRYFFKEAFRDFLAPETLTKQKHGFGMPTGIWLARDADLSAMVRDAVDALTRRGVLRPGFGARLFDEYVPRQPHHYGTLLWLLLILEHWYRNHRDVVRRAVGERLLRQT